MKMKEICHKPISKILVLLLLFAVTYALIGESIGNSIENILVSNAKVHNQPHTFALVPIPNEKHYENIEKISLREVAGISNRAGIITSDGRVTALRQFLIDYNSPMYPYAHVFVAEADNYGLDWRLVTAISGVESAFGSIPVRANNAWGWKGGSDGDFNNFDSWEAAIQVVTRRLALGYGIHMTPFEIEPIYCPPCGQNPQHLWANGVVKFMNQLDMYLLGF
jgi:hypothetical protein